MMKLLGGTAGVLLVLMVSYLYYVRVQYDRQMSLTHEQAAVRMIGAIQVAETQYRARYGRFAEKLDQLGPPASGEPGPDAAELISKSLAEGTSSSYSFAVAPLANGYLIQAIPFDYKNSGRYAYYSDQTLAVRRSPIK